MTEPDRNLTDRISKNIWYDKTFLASFLKDAQVWNQGKKSMKQPINPLENGS